MRVEASRGQLKEAGKSEVRAAEQVEADFTVEAIFVGVEKGDFPKACLVFNGTPRQYELSKAFDGEVPGDLQRVEADLKGYRVMVNAVAKSGNHYTRQVETLQVLRLRPAK